MNRIEKKFVELKKNKKKALSVFLTAGYPSLLATEKLILELENCGVDFFEIGFPFSDPVADGSTIQSSSDVALKNGMTWRKVLELCRRVRRVSQVPLVLMSYANPLFCRGWKNAVRDLASAGFDGVIIPDMIPDENQEVRSLFRRENLSLIYLLAPTSTPKRIKKICKESSGFVYCVSVTGVTGARKNMPARSIQSFLNRVKSKCCLPLILGFGLSKPEQLREFKKSVDGFVIGSALIRSLGTGTDVYQIIHRARKFIRPFIRKMTLD